VKYSNDIHNFYQLSSLIIENDVSRNFPSRNAFVCTSPGVRKFGVLLKFAFVLPVMHRAGLSTPISLSCIENIYQR